VAKIWGAFSSWRIHISFFVRKFSAPHLRNANDEGARKEKHKIPHRRIKIKTQHSSQKGILVEHWKEQNKPNISFLVFPCFLFSEPAVSDPSLSLSPDFLWASPNEVSGCDSVLSLRSHLGFCFLIELLVFYKVILIQFDWVWSNCDCILLGYSKLGYGQWFVWNISVKSWALLCVICSLSLSLSHAL
jgi:hypothetical protein